MKRAKVMGVDTFHTARMLAERPRLEDVVAFTLTTNKQSLAARDGEGGLTSAEWLRGPVREQFPLV
ncbi:hypothetical protein [Archangium lansingense]|uniref:Uncharacterized protein n=1 Tax=Archangium lansingense TaxID=2995310 RepID=A0ABT3ZV60_9BACT|nr:hypothetical protein [Archangium lansinium]MCY1073280.1 hypothetical protein [Archangium lansinium]